MLVAVCLLSVSLAGCGGLVRSSPASSSTRSATAPATARATAPATARGAGALSAAVARTRRTHELPTPPGRVRVLGGWRHPTQAVRAFAETYVNWTAATVAARLRTLAEVSVAQARSAMLLQAREVAADGELHRGGIANAGVVEAVAPVAGDRHQYAVVTRERTTAAADDAYRGLAPEWHVSVATVRRMSDGLWVLCGWQPES
jgi:hypothetical protein